MKEQVDFSKGKLFPIILRYSIPASVSLLITAVYNIVDRILLEILMAVLRFPSAFHYHL